jgi:L,D-transpeptidase ErfK/SrfK
MPALFVTLGHAEQWYTGGYQGGYYMPSQQQGAVVQQQQGYGYGTPMVMQQDQNGNYVVVMPNGQQYGVVPQQYQQRQAPAQQQRHSSARSSEEPAFEGPYYGQNTVPDPAITASIGSVEAPFIPPSNSASQTRQQTVAGHLDEVIGAGLLAHPVGGGESLGEVARAYDLGHNDITLANPGVREFDPPPGTHLRLALLQVLPDPGVKNGLVINLPEMRIYHHRANNRVDTFPVGIGKVGTDTPVGSASIVRKQARPTWHVPKSIKAKNPGFPDSVPPGPNNPLGTHALYLSLNGYLIHGTTQPYGIGRRVSHGCIRMYPEDIVQLFGQVPIGESVKIVNQPVKSGWHGEELYLEVHPPLRNRPVGNLQDLAVKSVRATLDRRSSWQNLVVDWNLVRQVVSASDGVPVRVGGRNITMEALSSPYGAPMAAGMDYGQQQPAMMAAQPQSQVPYAQVPQQQQQAATYTPVQQADGTVVYYQ